AYFDIGLVTSPRPAHWLLVLPPVLDQLRGVPNNPTQDGTRGNEGAKFCQDCGEVAVAQLISQIPPDGQKNHIIREPTLSKQRVTSLAAAESHTSLSGRPKVQQNPPVDISGHLWFPESSGSSRNGWGVFQEHWAERARSPLVDLPLTLIG